MTLAVTLNLCTIHCNNNYGPFTVYFYIDTILTMSPVSDIMKFCVPINEFYFNVNL